MHSPILQSPVITIKEARKLMGKDAQKLSDDKLLKLIENLDMLAMLQLNMVPKKVK